MSGRGSGHRRTAPGAGTRPRDGALSARFWRENAVRTAAATLTGAGAACPVRGGDGKNTEFLWKYFAVFEKKGIVWGRPVRQIEMT
jgi:hypothetical protein